ncbi:MAG: hypothetical protein KJ614_17445 [Gammaproteobacteria bacterium]|nr:hypothetical protein [Rhodoferax sp.]MBU3900675.1 hypothetical protein [Gammaproteobacteria bacterium]MBU3998399.1 hypothetical protein [Gammaproteobacteria bacterium]MBU4081333.1 hypothetical protein [Gammaproteobacteria bacterium]MBU4114521.1 hypothetical protein [Gammaproteobacteria bacterium]MBU4169862.1 hypothetical protein [Gammaproteobacteria bacterium]
MELMLDLTRELGATLVLLRHHKAPAARCQRVMSNVVGRVPAEVKS